jgi:uncharacterized protein HemY
LELQPETFVEVACRLIEASAIEDAARWIDEALRHQELPMLRFLLAFCHLKFGGKDFEAAKEIQQAVKPEVQPPYPWRSLEIAVLKELSLHFEESRIQEWLSLYSRP